MDSLELDNVKAEKADAMRRYNRKQKLNYLFHVFVPLVLLFWSSKWILIAIETGANCLREITPTVGKPLFPFMLINVLIFIIFILSLQKPSKQPNLYDEYVTNTASSRLRITTQGDSLTPKELYQETSYDKKVICSSPVEKATKTELCPIQTDTVDTVTETEEEEEKRQELVVVDIEPERPRTVHDKMSDVEFNVVVSTYIYKQNKAWWQERIARQRKAVFLRN